MTRTNLAPPADPAAAHARRRMILVAMCVALVAVVASVSGLNVAQQDLAVDLGASQNALLWIINGYTMVLAALLLPVGAIGDRFGRRRVLLAGLALFALSNVVAATAASATTLLVARLAGGAGAAMIMPVTLSVITASFPADERARAVGTWAGFASAGGILGLFFSAAMVDWAAWRWVFTLPVALCLVAFSMTVAFVEESREHAEHAFDLGGSLLSALAIGGLVLGIHEGPEHGWTTPLTLLGLVGGLVAAVAFVAWERRHAHPLLDVRVFRNRTLAAGASTILVMFAAMFGLFLVLVQYLQAVLGYSALRSASGLLPMALVLMPMANAAPAVVARAGMRRTLITGAVAITAGFVLLATTTSSSAGYLGILPGLLAIGFGMGLAMTPSTVAITDALPEAQQGVASALNDTVRELGGALGVALLGSVLSSGYRSSVATTASALPDAVRAPVENGIGSALAVAPRLGADGPTVVAAARNAFVDGWQAAMWVGALLAGVAVVLLVVRGPRDRVAAVVDGEPALAAA